MIGSDDDWGAWKSDRGSRLRARGPARLQERGPWHVPGVPHTASADEIHSVFQALALESLFESPLETQSAKAGQSAKADLLEAAYDAIMESYKVRSGQTAAGQCLAAPAGAAAAPAAAAAAPAGAAAQAKK